MMSVAIRYWFLVLCDQKREFGGACFVPSPQAVMTRPGIEKAASDAGFQVPAGAYLYGHPCPYDYTPPPAYRGKLLTETDWRAFWMSCASPATS